MIKLVGVTMRVDVFSARGERRDAIDQRLSRMIVELGGIPVPVVNCSTRHGITALNVSAIVLSGGNDLGCVGGETPERDELEHEILSWAEDKHAPVLGICRGMQVLAVDAGCSLSKIEGHVCNGHSLYGKITGNVPSHHNWCVEKVPRGYSALAQAPDGTCEAMLRHDGRRLGMMWHPERITPLRRIDANLIKDVLQL